MTTDDMHDDRSESKTAPGHNTSAKIITVKFHRDTLIAVERFNGVFVAVTPICNALGLDPKRQRDRIQRDPILNEGGAMMALPSSGGIQETFCLRLDLINGWLFTIDETRVKDEQTRRKVMEYKRECYGALFDYFYGTKVGREDPHEVESPKVRMVTEARHTFGEKAAGQLWIYLRLPVVPAMLQSPRNGDLFEFACSKLT